MNLKKLKLKGIKDFFAMNKTAIIVVLVLLAGMIYLNLTDKALAETVSNVVSVPSFIISFFVINAITISRGNLEAYHKKKLLDEDANKQRWEEVKLVFDDQLCDVKNLYKSHYLIYIRNKRNKTNILPANVNKCKNSFNKLRDFYLETYEYVRRIVDDTDSELGLLNEYVDDKNDISLSMKDFELMQVFFEKTVVPKEYFVLDDVSEENAEEFEKKLETLEEVFGTPNSIFEKYLKICQSIRNKSEGGIE